MNDSDGFAMVWFKRDLRLRDHQPLCKAIALGKPIVLVYVIEPWQNIDPHFDIRHWRFIYESLVDLNEQLSVVNAHVVVCQSDMVCLIQAWKNLGLSHIFSHEEVGLQSSYQRDIDVKQVCEALGIIWDESVLGALKRPLTNRLNWRSHWASRMKMPIFDPQLEKATFFQCKGIDTLLPFQILIEKLPKAWQKANKKFQPGGEKRAWYTLKDFFKERGKRYFGNIGKPEQARSTCSRLSVYLTWGNISIKQVYQYSRTQSSRDGWKASVKAFQSRLSWHCHFIQKFESEHQMEFRDVNKAYQHYKYNESEQSELLLNAWKYGKTGFPIIDAGMRALVETGYLNFRMRAMLVSFLCHHLGIDWRRGVSYMGALFLDFEPGIHYPQFQMQAGVTGTNTIRLYNPIKQSKEKDPQAVFIKKWLPCLSSLPVEYIHEPYSIPPIEAAMLEFDVERDYYLPVIDISESYRSARDKLWSFRERDDVKAEARRILYRHSVMK